MPNFFNEENYSDEGEWLGDDDPTPSEPEPEQEAVRPVPPPEVADTQRSVHTDGGLVIGELDILPPDLPVGSITFSVAGGREVLRFDPDGRAYVQGQLVDQPEEVIHALRWFCFHLSQPNRPEPSLDVLRPASFKVPAYVLGQRLRCPDGFVGQVVAIFYGFNITEAWGRYLSGPRYDDNQVFYGLFGVDDGDRVLVGEHSATPVIPRTNDEPNVTRISVWERILAECAGLTDIGKK